MPSFLIELGYKMMSDPLIQAIETRRSIRKYQKDIPDSSLVKKIIEAGLYAPHAGDQLPKISVIEDPELIRDINSLAKEAAKLTDLPHIIKLGEDAGYDCTYGAPIVAIVSSKEGAVAPESDAAAVAENILIAASALGLGSCWLFFPLLCFFGPQGDDMRKRCLISPGYKPYMAISLGYSSETPKDPVVDFDRITYIK